MAQTKILRPSAIGTQDQWTLGGTSKVSAVDTGDPVSHNDATDYIYTASNGKYQLFTVTAIPPMSAVNSVQMGVRTGANSGTGSPSATRILILGANSTTAASTAHSGAGWITSGPSTFARPGGGSWTPADIADSSTSFQMGVISSLSATNNLYCTSIWLVLNYEPVGSFFLPIALLLGAGSGLVEAARACSWFNARQDTVRLDLDDAKHLLDFHRAWRRPAFAFLGAT